jgi:hypothetical protein
MAGKWTKALHFVRPILAKIIPSLALGIPVIALRIVLLCCETAPREVGK